MILIYILLGIALTIIITILALVKIESNTKKEISRMLEIEKSTYYQKTLERLAKNTKDRKKTIEEIDKLARQFFLEYHAIAQKADYSEIVETLRKKENKRLIEFAEKMLELSYSKKESSILRINELIYLLDDIFKENTQKVVESQK